MPVPRSALYLACLCATVAGILLGRYLPPLAVIAFLLTMTGAVGGACLVFPGVWKAVLIPCAFMALGMLLMFLTIAGIRGGVLPRLSSKGQLATVTGRVLSGPGVER